MPDGTPSSEMENFRQALRHLRALYGHTEATAFGPLALRAVQNKMIELGWCRTHLDKQISRIRSVFKWAASQELLPSSIDEALRTVNGLKWGRSTARETEAIKPVPESHILAVLPHVSRQVRALIELQLLTAARAGELVAMRRIYLDTTDPETWIYQPVQHKTARHGHKRQIYLGPRAQEIVRPFLLDRPPEAFLFSPVEAEAERRAQLHASRATPLSCGNRPGSNRSPVPKRQPRDHYDVDSYRRAIQRACQKGRRYFFCASR
jgi:integrase